MFFSTVCNGAAKFFMSGPANCHPNIDTPAKYDFFQFGPANLAAKRASVEQ